MTRRQLAQLLLFAAIAAGLFVRLGHDRVYPTSEARCFAVVDEMLRSGDWLLPRLDGHPRLQKPPLFYWAAATVATLADGNSLFTLRSVSAAASLLLALAVFWEAGLEGAFVLAACALFWVRGRVGDAEPLLALLVFLSLVAFARLWFAGDRRMAPALALLVGLGFLTKATAALLGVLAPIGVWLALQRSLSSTLRPRTLAWAAVAVAIGLSWYALILVYVPGAGEQFREFLVSPFGKHDAAQDATHVRWPTYYLIRFPAAILPAGVLLIPLGIEAWRTRLWRDDPELEFWAVAFLAQFVAWSLVPGKQIHYLLPLVPILAVIAGRRIAARLGS